MLTHADVSVDLCRNSATQFYVHPEHGLKACRPHTLVAQSLLRTLVRTLRTLVRTLLTLVMTLLFSLVRTLLTLLTSLYLCRKQRD